MDGIQLQLSSTDIAAPALRFILDAMTFADRLRQARDLAGVTQQQLADACGLTAAAVSKWEGGKTDAVLAPNLFAVADFLRVDARWLATGEGEPRRPTTALDEIVQGLESASIEQQEAVRQLVTSLKK